MLPQVQRPRRLLMLFGGLAAALMVVWLVLAETSVSTVTAPPPASAGDDAAMFGKLFWPKVLSRRPVSGEREKNGAANGLAHCSP